MLIEPPAELVSKISERRALLWICQRTELREDADPHDERTSFSEAVGRYRQGLTTEDHILSRVFWEACWTESIVDLFYDAVSQGVGSSSTSGPWAQSRLPYRFTTDPDNEGQIDRRRFLPIYEINGTSRAGDPDGQHGGSVARRIAYKMGLIRRLEDFPGRALLIVGAERAKDLETVVEALDFVQSNSPVFLLWPSEIPFPDETKLPSRLSVHVIRGSSDELIDALVALGAPDHIGASKLGIRYGRSTLELSDEDLTEIDRDFVLIKENDLAASPQPGEVGNLVERLWRSEPDDWIPFASELVFRRYHRPFAASDQDLVGYIVSELQGLNKSERVQNVTLTIPATSGSGITTTLRNVAFHAAQSGFPTLLCKPSSQRFSVEKLGAFLTRLQERNREQLGGGDDLPTLIVFDREHRGIEQVSELATLLASRGRHALIVEVVPPIGDDADGPPTRRPRGKHSTTQEFRGVLDHRELRALAEHFADIYEPAHVPVPTVDDWFRFQQRQTVQTLSGEQSPGSLFWVALRFFVEESDPEFDVAEWIIRTFEERVKDPAAKLAVRYIAAFSSFGIAVPLVPVLRKAGTSKILDTSVISTLRELSVLEDILQWGDSEEYLHDQTIFFKHRLIAIQLLTQLGVPGWNDRLRECWGFLEILEASPIADTWLVETLVFEALRLDRNDSSMNDRLPVVLETMGHIPPVIASRSAPTQHHWGRTLGLQARQVEDPRQKEYFYSQAIDKLALASDLAISEKGREHPRNIYNSLGVMRSELSRLFRNNGQLERSEVLWQSAATAFDNALNLGADNFVVLSAYANRLIEHAREVKDESVALSDVASALSFLAQAEETALSTDSLSQDDAFYIERERNNAWQIVNADRAEQHIETMIEEGNEVGFVLKAYRILVGLTSQDWREGTKEQIEAAFEVLHSSDAKQMKNRSWRSVFLLYRVASSARARRHDFDLRLGLLDQLEVLAFRWYSALRFAQAVLCYQTGNFVRGFNLFRALRSGIVSGDLQPMRLNSFWRDMSDPSIPRQASVRIQRVTSDWVAYGEVPEMDGQRVLARPRWFEVQPKTGDVRPCHIAFELNGPLAVPTDRRLGSLID